MSGNRAEDLMKKHPSWFISDFHPIRFAKRPSEVERKEEKETKAEKK